MQKSRFPLPPCTACTGAPLAFTNFTHAKPARRFGLCPKTLFRWANASLIHPYTVNARVSLFDEAEVFAFIAMAKVAASSTSVEQRKQGEPA